MGIKKRFGILIMLILLVIPMVFALDTPIKIKTNPEMEVTVRVLNIDGTGTLEGGAFLDKPSGDEGIVEVVFSSEAVNSNKVDISIMLRKNGVLQKYSDGSSVRLIDNNGEHIKSGWPIEIDITVDPPVLVKSGRPAEENTTTSTTTDSDNSVDVVVEVEEELEENTKEIDSETQPGITGKAIGVGKIFTSKITYYIVGGLIIVLVIVFVVKKKLDSNGGKGKYLNFKTKKGNDKKESLSGREELADAEKKLEEARKELEEVKVKDEKEEKIRTLKARFERDKSALEELEKE